MIAAIFAYAYALGILALVGEANSTALIVIGWIMAIWMAITGSISGWVAARQ